MENYDFGHIVLHYHAQATLLYPCYGLLNMANKTIQTIIMIIKYNNKLVMFDFTAFDACPMHIKQSNSGVLTPPGQSLSAVVISILLEPIRQY